MSERDADQVNRRGFLQTGAAATAATLALAAEGQAQQDSKHDTQAPKPPLPTRTLGSTGVKVSILNQGTWKSPETLPRLLGMGYANGVRYIDTAKSYLSEPGIAKWFESMPAGTRKEYFLVSKDHPGSPRGLIKAIDERLAALKTDYLDLLFMHGIGGKEHLEWPKSQEFKETIATLKKSGKVKFVGFSCHDALKVQYLNNAAEGGFVDAIMIAYDSFLAKDAPFNRALDACHKAGIGLISMKQVAGNDPAPFLREVQKHVPSLQERGLSPYQGLLHAIWSDERISSCCVSMRNTDQLRENTHAARVYEPLKQAEIDGLHRAILAARPSFCANCDGGCSRAAGTEAALGDLARLYTYHEQYGFRGEAREQYAALSDAERNWQGADLEAARQACHKRLDFANLLPKVDRYLA